MPISDTLSSNNLPLSQNGFTRRNLIGANVSGSTGKDAAYPLPGDEPVSIKAPEIPDPYGIGTAGRNALTGASRLNAPQLSVHAKPSGQFLDDGKKYIARTAHQGRDKDHIDTADLLSKASTPTMTP